MRPEEETERRWYRSIVSVDTEFSGITEVAVERVRLSQDKTLQGKKGSQEDQVGMTAARRVMGQSCSQN